MDEHRGRDLWFRWVLANAGGAVGGALAATFLSMPFLFFFGYLGILLGPSLSRGVSIGLCPGTIWSQRNLLPATPLAFAHWGLAWQLP